MHSWIMIKKGVVPTYMYNTHTKKIQWRFFSNVRDMHALIIYSKCIKVIMFGDLPKINSNKNSIDLRLNDSFLNLM